MTQLVNEHASLVSNDQVGPRLFVMTLKSPEIAKRLRPGQFVHMKIPGMNDHILRRPFSIYAWDVEAGTIDILYQVVGYGSNHMTQLDADYLSKAGSIELIGPVGNCWAPTSEDELLNVKHALVVAGGAGAPAVFMLAKHLLERGAKVDVVMGAATKDALVCLKRYEDLIGKPVFAATDDGSFGRSGFCTSLVEEELAKQTAEGNCEYDYVATCGPTPLMRIVAKTAESHGVLCEVSMEKRMACGVGACLSCVVDTTEGKKRACVDGPIFDSRKVVW